MPLICEGVVTTRNADDSANISPMGPIVDAELTSLIFRPFQTSRTYQNLKRTGQGVFHVVDDVLLVVRAILDKWEQPPVTLPAKIIAGDVLEQSCRWLEFEVLEIEDSEERTTIETRIVHTETVRDFFGFNRAKHAVLELAILSTRLFMLPREEVLTERDRLKIAIDKTAGEQERAAFELLSTYIDGYDPASH